MDPKQMAQSADPSFLGNYLASLPRPEHMHHGPAQSSREDYFNGHHVVIKTTYEILVDDKPLNIHIALSNDGSAYCHGLPAYQFMSVVDMVRQLIEFFPDDFPADGAHPANGGHHPGHG